jgi:hypothetical protein
MDRVELFLRGARGEDVDATGCEFGEDVRDLRWSFTRGENDLGHSGAQGTMMVDLGEAEIFEGKRREAIRRIFRRELAGFDLAQEFEQSFTTHLVFLIA